MSYLFYYQLKSSRNGTVKLNEFLWNRIIRIAHFPGEDNIRNPGTGKTEGDKIQVFYKATVQKITSMVGPVWLLVKEAASKDRKLLRFWVGCLEDPI